MEAESIKSSVSVDKKSSHRACSSSTAAVLLSNLLIYDKHCCQKKTVPRGKLHTPCVCTSTRHHDESFRARQQAKKTRPCSDLHRIDLSEPSRSTQSTLQTVARSAPSGAP